MARAHARTQDQIRDDLERERRELVAAVDRLRGRARSAVDIGGRVRTALPRAAAGAVVAGLVLGGLRAAGRRLVRRRR